MLLDSFEFPCPWCGELNQLPQDPDELGQQLVQDCSVCCAPILIDRPAWPDQAPIIRREGD